MPQITEEMLEADIPLKEILLVEDNPDDAYIIKRHLSVTAGMAFNITHIETMKDTLAILKSKRFDIILLDLNLSDSEKMDTVRSVSSATDAAIIVLTSQPSEELALQAVKAGIQDFMDKNKLIGSELLKTLSFSIERQKQRNRLHGLAYRDSLTGLPNANSFSEKCQDAFRSCSRGEKLALHIIHIKNLKDIIMTYGLPVGEAMLKAVSSRLYGVFQQDKIFARLESDNLGLLQQKVEHEGHVLYIGRRILETFGAPLDVMGHSLTAELMIGIAIYPDHGADWETLYNHACLALKQVEQGHSPHSRCQIYQNG